MNPLEALNNRVVIVSEDPEIVARRALLVSRIYVALAAFFVLIILLYGGLFVLYVQVQEHDGSTVELQSDGFETRAVNCQVLVSLGEELPPSCLEAPVVALYDPEAPPTAGVNSEGQELNRALLCGLYGELGLAIPEVCEP